MKSRDQLEMQREIELTGTYVNPFAGDVEETTDPITGETTKVDKTPSAGDPEEDDDGPQIGGTAGQGGGPPRPAGEDDVDDDGKSGIDILKDLI